MLMPAKWSMNTALGMARLAAGAVPGLAPVREVSDEADAGWDLSALSEEEIQTFLALSQKICAQGKKQPGKQVQKVPE
jgi:hypothetical protein